MQTEKNLYVIEMKSDNYRIKTFDLSSQTLTNDTKLDLAVNKKEHFAAIKNGRVYFLLGNEVDQGSLTYKPVQLLIADLKTGKTLYKGETVMHKKEQQKFWTFYQ
ncbi:hypothetical protein RCO48_18045 [Peribacillus frigoritolerans]|nr:hypothetical protein [Peribacillus frigoritolerans]